MGLSERVLHEMQNHLLCDDKISRLRNRKVCMPVVIWRNSISRFLSETEEHKRVLQDTVQDILCVFEIKLLAANDTLLSPSKTTSSISTISCWELKSKGATPVFDKLRFQAHKKFDGSIGLVEFFLTVMLTLIACNMERNSLILKGLCSRGKA